MKRLIACTGALFVCSSAHAQLEINWHTIDGGSAVMTGGTFELRGTVGQPDAGEVRTNAISSMGGFWAVGYTFCLADTTTQNAPIGDPLYGVPDGIVAGGDLQFYVNLWVAGDPFSDLTTQNAPQGDPDFGVPDGLVTGADLQFFVNAWFAGCP